MVFASVVHSDIYISGDVRIDPGAVIAPGVVIQASANNHVAIAAGVCLGMGAILQAHQGNIEICQGAMIGAGVLIVGNSSIGENACIGYGTTIFRASILAATVIPPSSLLGDVSRKLSECDATNGETDKKSRPGTEPIPKTTKNTQTDPWGEELQSPTQPIQETSTKISTQEDINQPSPDDVVPEVEKEQEIIIPSIPEIPETPSVTKEKAPVVGQVYINQLLMTLFPQNNQIPPPNNSSFK